MRHDKKPRAFLYAAAPHWKEYVVNRANVVGIAEFNAIL